MKKRKGSNQKLDGFANIGPVARYGAEVDCWLPSVHHSPLLFNQEVKNEGEMVNHTSVIFFGLSSEVISSSKARLCPMISAASYWNQPTS